MTHPTHLWKEDFVEHNGHVVAGATIESDGGVKSHLWYRFPSEYRHLLTESADPFVVATLFFAMKKGTDLIVHGQVSPSLLQNLEEFQSAWSCWCPARYSKIEIRADLETELKETCSPDSTISAFSGGVDSCFTVWRHHSKNCGRSTCDIRASLMVHGFDIPLGEHGIFVSAADRSRRMLDDFGIELITMATNFREFSTDDWSYTHGAAVASCLMFFQGTYKNGLIPSTDPYNYLVLPWGSNPLTDRLLSCNSFSIIHDGASFSRNEKVREISRWPAAAENLRVCHQGEFKDRNCGRCEKCIRTILNFRVMGLQLPPCFEQDISNNEIEQLNGLNNSQIVEFEQILFAARDAGITESWVKSLERCIKKARRADNGTFIIRIRRKLVIRSRFKRLRARIYSPSR